MSHAYRLPDGRITQPVVLHDKVADAEVVVSDGQNPADALSDHLSIDSTSDVVLIAWLARDRKWLLWDGPRDALPESGSDGG